MLERSFDTARINEVINHPSVRPYVGPGDYFADVTPLVNDTNNWFLMGEHGGFGLTQTTPGVHEIHTFILPEGRGAWARDAAQVLLDFARENGDNKVWTKVPSDQKNVEVYTRRAGLKPTGEEVELFGKPYKVFGLEFSQCLS
jgi:hypothetical protein